MSENQANVSRQTSARFPAWKRAMDIMIALAALILLAGPMLVIALLIRIADGSPVLYRQTRLGQGGRHIKIIKFRSMCRNAEQRFDLFSEEELAQYQREFKIDRDPRVTKLGGFLRKTSLDELPQLWNILRGDLSIVGPRPILPDEICHYSDAQRDVFLSARPGLTGYWQACSKPDDTYTTGKRQLMELHYAQNISIGFDVRIILHTVSTVIRKALHGA